MNRTLAILVLGVAVGMLGSQSSAATLTVDLRIGAMYDGTTFNEITNAAQLKDGDWFEVQVWVKTDTGSVEYTKTAPPPPYPTETYIEGIAQISLDILTPGTVGLARPYSTTAPLTDVSAWGSNIPSYLQEGQFAPSAQVDPDHDGDYDAWNLQVADLAFNVADASVTSWGQGSYEHLATLQYIMTGNGEIVITAQSGEPGTNGGYWYDYTGYRARTPTTFGSMVIDNTLTVGSSGTAPTQMTVTASGSLGVGGQATVSNAAGTRENGVVTVLTKTGWDPSGKLTFTGIAEGNTVAAGDTLTGTVGLNDAGLLNGIQFAGTVNMTVDGTTAGTGTANGEACPESYVYTVAATSSHGTAGDVPVGGGGWSSALSSLDMGAGANLKDLASETPANGDTMGVEARILAGTFGVGTSGAVTMAWRSRTAAEHTGVPGGIPGAWWATGLLSDVVDMSVPGSDLYVLQMEYREEAIILDYSGPLTKEEYLIAAGHLFLAWYNPATSAWENAGDTAGYEGADTDGFQESDLLLGKWGVDKDANTVWAVLNHSSQFSVIPEPSVVVLLGLGAAGLIARRRRRNA